MTDKLLYIDGHNFCAIDVSSKMEIFTLFVLFDDIIFSCSGSKSPLVVLRTFGFLIKGRLTPLSTGMVL